MLEKIRAMLGEASGDDARAGEGGRFDRCVLHIGSEKTGTSTIQRFLTRNRDALARDGVIYPAATGAHGGSQWGFVASAHDKAWETDVGMALGIRSPEEQQRYVAGLRRDLQQEFDALPEARTLVISSEHFHSRLHGPAAITGLKGFLAEWVDRVEVVLYLRRQDRVAVSLYSTKIKSGSVNPVVFPGAAQGPVPYYFDYERIYDNWQSVFGEQAVRVRLFDPAEFAGGDLLTDFCAVAGLDMTGKQLPPAENTALDAAGAAFLLEVNRQLPNAADGSRNRDRVALAQLVAGLSSGRIYPASHQQARDFYGRFEEANERLKARLFPDRTAPLFDDDFSDYPESIEALTPRYEDAVAMAIRMWRALS